MKGTEHSNCDAILALVEIKRSPLAEVTALSQIADYLEVIRFKNYADEFVGFLSMGERTIVWTTQRQRNHRRQVQQNMTVETGSIPFCNFLRPVYERYKD